MARVALDSLVRPGPALAVAPRPPVVLADALGADRGQPHHGRAGRSRCTRRSGSPERRGESGACSRDRLHGAFDLRGELRDLRRAGLLDGPLTGDAERDARRLLDATRDGSSLHGHRRHRRAGLGRLSRQRSVPRSHGMGDALTFERRRGSDLHVHGASRRRPVLLRDGVEVAESRSGGAPVRGAWARRLSRRGSGPRWAGSVDCHEPDLSEAVRRRGKSGSRSARARRIDGSRADRSGSGGEGPDVDGQLFSERRHACPRVQLARRRAGESVRGAGRSAAGGRAAAVRPHRVHRPLIGADARLRSASIRQRRAAHGGCTRSTCHRNRARSSCPSTVSARRRPVTRPPSESASIAPLRRRPHQRLTRGAGTIRDFQPPPRD